MLWSEQVPAALLPPTPFSSAAGGCCFDFSRDQESLFIVGSEDGSLYKCSTAYASEYLQVRGWLAGGRGMAALVCAAPMQQQSLAAVAPDVRWTQTDGRRP